MSNSFVTPMDYGLPGSSVHGIILARISEWVAISSSRGSSWPRDRMQSPALTGRFFATKSSGKPTAAKRQALCWELCTCLLNLIPHNSMKQTLSCLLSIRHCSKILTGVASFNLHNNPIKYPALQMRKTRHWMGESFAQYHIAIKRQDALRRPYFWAHRAKLPLTICVVTGALFLKCGFSHIYPPAKDLQ